MKRSKIKLLMSILIIGVLTSAACLAYPPLSMPEWIIIPGVAMIAMITLWMLPELDILIDQ